MVVKIRLTRKRVAVSLAAITLILAAGVAYAAIPDSNGVYTACKLNATGTIRLIDPSLGGTSLLGRCTSLETQVTWNQAGERGPQGPPGPEGPKGDPGAGGSLASLNGTLCKAGSREGTTSIAAPGGGPPGVVVPLSITCIFPDGFEPNETRATAADISGSYTVFPGGFTSLSVQPTFHTGDDHDWFVLNNAELRTIGQPPPGVHIDVYRDGELVGSTEFVPPGAPPPAPPGNSGAFVNTVPGPHKWELHATSMDSIPLAYFVGGSGP